MKKNIKQQSWTASLLCAGALFLFASIHSVVDAAVAPGRQVSESGIRHSFLICGSTVTAIFDEDSVPVWSVPGKSRDGMVLPNGNVLICFSKKVAEYKAGTQDVVWSYTLAKPNKELATAWRLPNGNTLVVENGKAPRLREVSLAGDIVVDFPLQPETKNTHMQTRMARKLPNGNYLVPHLLAFAVKEYTASGEVVREISTDLAELGGREKKNWPFSAVLLSEGRILVNLTNGHKSVIFDAAGKVLWRCDTDEVGGVMKDPCGVQMLANGNVVIGNYGEKKAKGPRVIEVNADKKVVWEFYHPQAKGHEIHILTTNGESLSSYQR